MIRRKGIWLTIRYCLLLVMPAFAAGMVAFFAPCCAGVMMPAYLAAIGGGRRLRVARLTAVYVLGVSVVVLPITLGAAALAGYVSRWHPQMFAIGGLMMIGVAVALWRGTMLPIDVPQPRMSGSALSVFGLGVFSGAASFAPIAAPPFQPSEPPPEAKIEPGRVIARWSQTTP